MMRKTIAMAAAVALLGACDSGADAPADESAAEGEVLGGTISDDMLPLDTVTSQSPPLRAAPESGEGGASEPVAADDGATEEAAADASEEPAEEEPAAPAPEESEDDGE